jgi:hypothetical protein
LPSAWAERIFNSSLTICNADPKLGEALVSVTPGNRQEADMVRKLVWAGLALILALPVSVAASTFVHVSPRELTAQADAVIRGQVLEVRSFWNDSATMILTDALVRVDETLVGEAPRYVTLRTFGGTVGGYTVEAAGFPEFRQNESMVAFIKAGSDGTHEILGYREGQYRVMRSRSGQILAVSMVENEARYLTPDGRADAEPRVMPLGDFAARIRQFGRAAGRVVDGE